MKKEPILSQDYTAPGFASVIDKSGPDFGLWFATSQVLLDKRSNFQRIQVIENQVAGRTLLLDTEFNTSTVMDPFYHEPMAHVPLAFVRDRKARVLIIGGGDFGVAKEVVKHQNVIRIAMCELDREILQAAREYFPQWAEVEEDPRLELVVEDGVRYVRSCREASFDTVIIDTTDPAVHAPELISRRFYQELSRVLAPGGTVMQIIDDAVIFKVGWKLALPSATKVFADVRPAFFVVPFYVTGEWGIMLARKDASIDLDVVDSDYLDGLGVRTLTKERVRAAFSLPPYITEWLAPLYQVG